MCLWRIWMKYSTLYVWDMNRLQTWNITLHPIASSRHLGNGVRVTPNWLIWMGWNTILGVRSSCHFFLPLTFLFYVSERKSVGLTFFPYPCCFTPAKCLSIFPCTSELIESNRFCVNPEAVVMRAQRARTQKVQNMIERGRCSLWKSASDKPPKGNHPLCSDPPQQTKGHPGKSGELWHLTHPPPGPLTTPNPPPQPLASFTNTQCTVELNPPDPPTSETTICDRVGITWCARLNYLD